MNKVKDQERAAFGGVYEKVNKKDFKITVITEKEQDHTFSVKDTIIT